MTTLLIVLTNVTCPWPVFSWDGCASFSTSLDPHPHTQKTPQKTREGLEKRKTARKREVRLSRLRQHTMTPIYTRSTSASICIFKKKYSAIFPCLLSVRVCMARLRTCGSNVSGGTTTVHLCVILCVSHVLTHTRTVKWASYGPV